MLVAPLTCGLLCFLGFLVAAIRTGERKYWISTAVYAGLFAAWTALIMAVPQDSLAYNLAVIPFLVIIVAPAVHAGIWNKDYLRTIANKSAWHSQYASPTQTMPAQEVTSGFMGVSNADYFAPGTIPGPATPASETRVTPAQPSVPASNAQPATMININAASPGELVTALGIDHALAAHVIAARTARGAFRDVDDLGAGAGLQPHQLIKFRNRVTFGSTPQAHDPNTHTGRILDF